MMTDQKSTFQIVAEEFAAAFTICTRTSNGEQFTKLRDDEQLPAWLQGDDGTDFIRTIHQAVDGRFPCDWLYSMLPRIAQSMAEGNTDSDEIADSLTDIYSAGLRAWLLDYRNAELCDEVAGDLGLPEPWSLDSYIQQGQYTALERAAAAMDELIEEEAEKRDDAEPCDEE